MKKIIGLFTALAIIAFLPGCNNAGNNTTAEKELELKQKELELKEKELAMKEKENSMKESELSHQSKSSEGQEKGDENSQLNKQNGDFYIINVAAVKNESDAKKKVKELEKSGYASNYLWIPDYPSLSGTEYYTVYVGPFATQSECEIATEAYRKKHPDAYGLLVSQKPTRVQINGVGKVKKTEAKNQLGC